MINPSATTILVTGGTGYIGSHTVVELQNQGFKVIIADNLSNSRLEVLDAIAQITGIKPEFEKTDLSDKKACEGLFRKHSFQAIIHFAALKAVNESVEKPLEYYRNNIDSLLNLLELCIKHDVRHFVFSSSCSVYGNAERLPIDENTPVQPAQSPYANTKKIGEDILRDAASVSTLNITALRYFNPVGAHSTALIGEYPLGAPLNLFPVVMQTAAGVRDKMLVYGNDYDTPDGSCIRDYIHVMDVAAAHVTAIKRMLEDHSHNRFQIFNIGTGKGISVLEILNAFEKVTGVKVKYEITGRRSGDVVKIYADTSLANKMLGWKAERTLDEMISSSWNWQQKLMSASEIHPAS
jgi:UDP-glucose 4-epimerase